MNTILLISILVLLIINISVLLTRKTENSAGNNKTEENRFIELKTHVNSILQDTRRLESAIREEIARNRNETQNALKDNREEIGNSFKILGETTNKTLNDIAVLQKSQLDTFSQRLLQLTKATEDRLTVVQEQLNKNALDNRTDLTNSLKNFQESFTANVRDFNELQKQKFDSLQHKQAELNTTTETRLNNIRETVEGRLKSLQDENIKKLDEMRATVDEKLQSTVEKRFNESFKLISDRLELVHRGLGEMQNLASGVGDLKKVLTNVKTRGTLGEIQLGTILNEFLSPEQFECNVAVKSGSLERVEFVVKLPKAKLPIDSKFPIEDYQRLVDIYENAVNYAPTEIDNINKQFERAVKKCAKDICEKYINPPETTDFALMFVPTEGLYAEILRRTGLFETLMRDFKITVVGPSNLVAYLSSLQMGFRTLAIEKRSSEVWEILRAIKTEFGKFGDILEKTKKKLAEASNVIDSAGVRSRAIERKLKTVQQMPSDEAVKLLENPMDNNGNMGLDNIDIDGTLNFEEK